jgi:hypothetical protein
VTHKVGLMSDETIIPKRSLPTLSVRFEPHVKKAVEKAARDDKRSASSLVEIATIAYLRERGYLPE